MPNRVIRYRLLPILDVLPNGQRYHSPNAKGPCSAGRVWLIRRADFQPQDNARHVWLELVGSAPGADLLPFLDPKTATNYLTWVILAALDYCNEHALTLPPTLAVTRAVVRAGISAAFRSRGDILDQNTHLFLGFVNHQVDARAEIGKHVGFDDVEALLLAIGAHANVLEEA
jgi:hypothetical protein